MGENYMMVNREAYISKWSLIGIGILLSILIFVMGTGMIVHAGSYDGKTIEIRYTSSKEGEVEYHHDNVTSYTFGQGSHIKLNRPDYLEEGYEFHGWFLLEPDGAWYDYFAYNGVFNELNDAVLERFINDNSTYNGVLPKYITIKADIQGECQVRFDLQRDKLDGSKTYSLNGNASYNGGIKWRNLGWGDSLNDVGGKKFLGWSTSSEAASVGFPASIESIPMNKLFS